MRPSPKISVITVTLNDRDGLDSMAASLQAQDYADIEHIIVDGESKDGTVEWLKTYSPSFPIKWISERDEGIFDAMNKGAVMSSGEVLVFMNAGDSFSDPKSLSHIAELWQLGMWDWAYGQMEYVDPQGMSQGFTRQYPHAQRGVELGTRFAPHQATYLSRQLFDSLKGFDLAFEYACDQELAIRAGAVSEPFVFQHVVAKFLQGGVHSQTTYWRRERIYRRMRLKNSVLVCNSNTLDWIYTESMAIYREVRERAGKLKRGIPMFLRQPRAAKG